MKKRQKFTRIVAALLCVLMVIGIVAGAASAATFPSNDTSNTKDTRSKTFDVRVNGNLVEFPDEKPFVDENNRTLVPIRFVMEALDATVYWDRYDKIVEVYKNGLTVKIKVGEKDILVLDSNYYWNNNNYQRVITMDTVAVAKNGRVFVPIRFVAEALGAHVDWSSAFNTVTVFCDGELTSNEIRVLRSYPYTKLDSYVSYETAKRQYASEPERLAYHYGTQRSSFNSFANAQEYLYEIDYLRSNYNHYFGDVGGEVYIENGEDFYDYVVQQAVEELAYFSWPVNIQVKADSSCIYHPDTVNGEYTVVRGFVTYRMYDNDWYYYDDYMADEDYAALEKVFGKNYNFIADGEDHVVPVDIHVRTEMGFAVTVADVIVLN